MHWSDIPLNPPKRMLRQFAGLWLVFFAGLACHEAFLRDRLILAIGFAVLSATVGPLGLIWPKAIRWLFVGWMVLAFPIGWTISHLMLACLFYGLFTPIACCFKLIGRDVLCRQPRPGQESYWTPKAAATDVRGYFRQS